ncbi:UPF0764 protein C16orf89 homolog isoform X1 [Diorhabda carinulata]|uniref:UPF0764 protein C16orf89 homolog isoform X1 n=1 Tax=Diorhabda carinulata TaxID=1163345 RepID=UPI0025A177D0|nr:UPF0764 protein C16orf89 homolog isoform X1 [Diorhabda carinulata]
MSRIPSCILMCLLLQIEGHILDNRVILKVRQSIEKTLDYIDIQHKRVNEDCLFGVVLCTAIAMDTYKNGTHVMDTSTTSIIKKSMELLNKSVPYLRPERKWVKEAILDWKLWRKEIQYKYGEMANVKIFDVLNKIRTYQNDNIYLSNMDYCFKDIANITWNSSPKKCFVDKKCWKIYYQDDDTASGYLLTHKLLLLQLARARKCNINKEAYYNKTKELCSQIYSEVLSGDYFDVLDDMFDLFFEETILCGYEGFTEFFSTKWLFYILKSQRSSGCFPPILTDKLKSKIKRSTTIFEDNCADHTTGIGLAVLTLYYNFIIKEIFV